MKLLISEAHKHSVLWNKWDKKYRDRNVIEMAWNNVSNKLKMYREDAKKKWRHLRDQFLKERKKVVKSRSGDGQECSEIYNGKWSFYHIMLFLKDTIMPRETESNISDTENAQENEDDHFSGTDETDVNKNRDYSHSTSYANVIEPSLSEQIPDVTLEKVIDSSEINPKKKPKRKEKTTSFEDQLLKIKHEKNQKISALLEKQMTNSDDDEVMHFFKSLLPYFKKMNALQKLRVRNIFQETILSELSSQTNQNLVNKTYDYNTANTGHSYATSSYASPNPTPIHYSLHPGTSVQIQHQNICSLDEDTN